LFRKKRELNKERNNKLKEINKDTERVEKERERQRYSKRD
jgi:hypothetical protein